MIVEPLKKTREVLIVVVTIRRNQYVFLKLGINARKLITQSGHKVLTNTHTLGVSDEAIMGLCDKGLIVECGTGVHGCSWLTAPTS